MEDEYQKFIRRMNPPRVVIDEESCKNGTIIQVLKLFNFFYLFECTPGYLCLCVRE
ncbi:putative ACT domain-containing protein ACR1-12 [Helianthus annuus]|nr:putative ACT domain-containing protein ACR1-12 [Helianthus annuus]